MDENDKDRQEVSMGPGAPGSWAKYTRCGGV